LDQNPLSFAHDKPFHSLFLEKQIIEPVEILFICTLTEVDIRSMGKHNILSNRKNTVSIKRKQ